MKLIECTNVSKRYSEKLALNNVSLSLEAGGPIALVGPNGAGKTTLFSLLCGFILPTTGDITILGHAVGSPALKGLMSALPQDAVLDPNFSILEQLTFFAQLQGIAKKDAKEEVLRVLGLVDLTDAAKLKPKSLSHGMAKRVAIAQALIGKPKLVLLDEPTSGLDPANAKKVRQIVKTLSSDTHFIISSHNLEELEKLCDHVIYLEKGTLRQSVSLKTKASTAYFTLVMETADYPALIEAVSGLTSVTEVKYNGEQQLVIAYAAQADLALDIDLLSLVSNNHWSYKMLLKGRTLEDTLFS
jgi:ABC-2 type transport system ATP-binding protein